MKLTKAKVAAATAPKGKRAKIGDGRGLWLVIGENGRKTWAYLYSLNGTHRYMGLGSIDFMSLDQARDTALQLRGQVKRGIDPWAVLQAERAANANAVPSPAEPLSPRVPTFEEVAEQCIAAKERSKKLWTNGKSGPQWRSSLKAYVYPTLGAKPVDQITSADLVAVLEPIWHLVPETAKRVRGRIGAVLGYAAAKDWRPDDDLTRAKSKLDVALGGQDRPEEDEGHASLGYAEIADFMPKLKAQPGFGARALEFAILTAARTGEVIGATWDEIDLDNAVWAIPKARMKARRAHDVPLSEAAVALLRSLDRGENDKHLFPSPNRAGQPLSNMALLATLKRMKRTDITAHGFRATFRTWAAERTEYPHEVVEAALAHVEGAVVKSYQRGTYRDRRRPMMEEWATFCAGGIDDSKVVPIRAAK